MLAQRDALIDTIYERASVDGDIFFLSADFGAPALDRYRRDLPDQFLHLGISEQNMIDVAAGLALDGRKVFCYGMAPFVSMRCLEQHKTASGLMNLPICTIVAGVGLGYADSGPTHYATEDLACLRALVGASVYTASDSWVASELGRVICEKPHFSFVRLDRTPLPDIAENRDPECVRVGLRLLSPSGRRVCAVSSGLMVHRVREAVSGAPRLANAVTIVDLIRNKPVPEALAAELSSAEVVVTVEEQTPSGGLGGAVLEFMADRDIVRPVRRITLPERYFFENGGRDKLLQDAKLGVDAIRSTIASMAAVKSLARSH